MGRNEEREGEREGGREGRNLEQQSKTGQVVLSCAEQSKIPVQIFQAEALKGNFLT